MSKQPGRQLPAIRHQDSLIVPQRHEVGRRLEYLNEQTEAKVVETTVSGEVAAYGAAINTAVNGHVTDCTLSGIDRLEGKRPSGSSRYDRLRNHVIDEAQADLIESNQRIAHTASHTINGIAARPYRAPDPPPKRSWLAKIVSDE